MTLPRTSLPPENQTFSSGKGAIATPAALWSTMRLLTTSASRTPASTTPLPRAMFCVARTGAVVEELSSTRLPATTTSVAGGSSSESRVLGTMPAALPCHHES